MTREEVYREIEEEFGLVPTYMTTIPDELLAQEWELWKRLELEETRIPAKYKHLIGLGVAAANRCAYCTLFHAEAARYYGATEEEIEEAVHFAKFTTGWTVYIHGMQVDHEQFKRELRQSMEHYAAKRERREAA